MITLWNQKSRNAGTSCILYWTTAVILTFSNLSDLFDHFPLNVQCTTAAATVRRRAQSAAFGSVKAAKAEK